jgi:hypothetical protein
MRSYKKILLKHLSQSGWELVKQEDYTDWWAEEQWYIKSIKQKWGYHLIITFLVDPQYKGNKKSQAVWAVSATASIPNDRVEAQDGVALIGLTKGKYNERLKDFVRKINLHRNEIDGKK